MDLDGEREGGFWSESNISRLDGWVARGVLITRRRAGLGVARRDAELF